MKLKNGTFQLNVSTCNTCALICSLIPSDAKYANSNEPIINIVFSSERVITINTMAIQLT